jgi:hypothetical protein
MLSTFCLNGQKARTDSIFSFTKGSNKTEHEIKFGHQEIAINSASTDFDLECFALNGGLRFYHCNKN